MQTTPAPPRLLRTHWKINTYTYSMQWSRIWRSPNTLRPRGSNLSTGSIGFSLLPPRTNYYFVFLCKRRNYPHYSPPTTFKPNRDQNRGMAKMNVKQTNRGLDCISKWCSLPLVINIDNGDAYDMTGLPNDLPGGRVLRSLSALACSFTIKV